MMRVLTRSTGFILVGLLLVALGVASWQLGWDWPLHRALRLADTRWPPRIIRLSALGGFGVMGPFGIAVILFLLLRRRAKDALWLFLTVASGRLMVEGVKLLLTRPRPPVADRLELVTSWSFPSSHSAGTMMTCVALAIVLGGRRHAASSLIAAFLAAGVIGWSRVALAVHWPGDVLAGWGFGLVWLGLALRIHAPRPVS